MNHPKLTLVRNLGRETDSVAGPPTDADLVRAQLQGDPKAFGELAKRHQVVLYRIARRYARGSDDASDLVQRVLVRALAAAPRIFPKLALATETNAVKAWLVRIVVNLGKNHARDAARNPRVGIDAVAMRLTATEDAHLALQQAQERALALACVKSLPRRQRGVFIMRIDGELPFADIGLALGITSANAKAHFHHALHRLRAEVARAVKEGSSI